MVVMAPDAALEPGITFADEKEPNDTLAGAQALLLTPAGEGMAAGIRAAGAVPKDTDLYGVLVPAGERRRMSIDVRPDAGVAVAVDVLDDKGQVLVASTPGAAGERDGLPNVSVIAGTYFVRIRLQAGRYRLVVRLFPADPAEESEPNGRAALATELPMAAPAGAEIGGFLGWKRDEDWYRVPVAGLPPGSVVHAEVDGIEGITASLAVYDSVEQKLAVQRGRKSERAVARNVLIGEKEPHLFVVVRGEGGRSLDQRYALRVRTEVAKAGVEVEPNDAPARATALLDGAIAGYLGAGDVDLYRYTAAEPAELAIEATPPERVDIKIEVVRESDSAVIAKADTGKRREAERLPNLFVPAGPVLLRLSAGKGDGNSDEPYRLTIAARPPEAGAEREPNATVGTATVLSAGVAGSGLVFPRGDIDVWRFAAPDDAETIAVSVKGVAGLAIEARVDTLAGKELARIKTAAGAQGSSRVTPAGEPCCLIHVREITGKASNPRDRYTLQAGP